MEMTTTTKQFCGDVWELIQQIDSADITIKTFGNVGTLISRYHDLASPLAIYQNGDEILVFDPEGKDQQHFDLEVLLEPEFCLSEPDVENILADRNMALGRVHIKRPHNGIKRPLVICDVCGKMLNRYESRYAYRTLYADVHDQKSAMGKLFVHFDYHCLKYHVMVPSATKKSHKMP